MEESKKMWASITAIAALLSGGGGYAAFEGLIYMADQRYVTIASQNKELKFAIEDEIADIQARIDAGVDTERDRTRLAVLQERLKQLSK